MKKFDRLPLQERKDEIQMAALELFNEKGFAATTMENIIQKVSLSKGGVYRIYPSTSAILSDLMIKGMHLRNRYYEERVKKELEEGKELSLDFLVEMIVDSLLLYPKISSVYAEFLWEKRRKEELEVLYQKICSETVKETKELICQCGAERFFFADDQTLVRLTEIMNASVLSMHTLNLKEFFMKNKKQLCRAILDILKI